MRQPAFPRLATWLLAAGLAAAAGAMVVIGGVYLYVAPGLPAVARLQDVELQQPLRIYAANGDLMGVYGVKRRAPVDIEDVPSLFRKAFIAAEDNRFYKHPGVDWQGIVRAAWNLVLTGDKSQGGSTITMQVARNFFLSREKTYIRKIREIFLALKIGHALPKDKVLELYLNKIYLGRGAYGIAAAARTYYGREIDELTLAEIATIAGLPPAPAYYNPIDHPQRARGRRSYVLQQMHDNGMIDEAALRDALAAPVTASSHAAPIEIRAPYLAEMARLEAVHRFGDNVDTRGYRVYTTVVPDEQRAATAALREALLDYERRHGYAGPLAELDTRRVPSIEQVRRLRAWAAQSGRDADPPRLPARRATRPEIVPPQVLDLDAMDAVLARHARTGNLEPAIVLAVGEDGATVYRQQASLARIAWPGMEWAAPRRPGGRVGAPPEHPGDVLAVGDVVHVSIGPADDRVRLAQRPDVQGALVALDPHDGAVRALVGGFDFSQSRFNRATQARRQPGSSFKPFVYAAALGKGFTAATLINDAPVVFDSNVLEDMWRPENYSGKVFGPTRLREGLVHSRNLVSLRVLRRIGVPYAVDYVQRFGFQAEQLPGNLTLALGTASVSPLQLARGYAVFANMGHLVDPYLVTRITTAEGEVVYRPDPAVVCRQNCSMAPDHAATGARGSPDADTGAEPRGRDETPLARQDRSGKLASVEVPDRRQQPGARVAPRVIPAQNAYLVRSFLRDVARRGTGRGTRALGRDDIGGKTGTTDDQRDAWFAGFNSSIVATAWVGYDGPRSLGRHETGARAALPMWIDFMRVALRDTPETWPAMPPGMVAVRIDPETGNYAARNTDDAVFEIFRVGNAPHGREVASQPRRNHLF